MNTPEILDLKPASSKNGGDAPGADGQVQLCDLVFAQSWEDPRSDERAFGSMRGSTIFSISSGGDNTLEFLLQSPERIYAVDINPAQNCLLELKQAAIRHLTYPQFAALMGIQAHENRVGIYQTIRDALHPATRAFWDDKSRAIHKGILYAGKFEGFLRYARLLLRLIQGKDRIQTLFEQKDIPRQREFFTREWDNRRIRGLFKLVFHRSIYPRGALKADYFTFDDGSASFAESYFRRFRHALSEIPVGDNYFLAMYLLGRYLNTSAMPLYLQEKHFSALREASGKIQMYSAGAIAFLESAPDDSIDCFSLSNICELMSEAETKRLFQEVARTSAPGARICFRNLVVPREAPAGLIRKDEKLSQELLNNDRSFIYSKVAAYRVLK